MKTLGVRELKERISEILRMVEEEGETIEIINNGEIMAHLVPVGRSKSSPEPAKSDVWADLDHLAAEIGAHWPADVSAVEAVRNVRREL